MDRTYNVFFFCIDTHAILIMLFALLRHSPLKWAISFVNVVVLDEVHRVISGMAAILLKKRHLVAWVNFNINITSNFNSILVHSGII